MESILTEVKALVLGLYQAEVKAFEGTGMTPDLRGCLASVAGPANILWKRRGGAALARRGEADPGDLFVMRSLGSKFHREAGVFDPDITLEQAVGVEPYGSALAESTQFAPPLPDVIAGTDPEPEPTPGGDS